MRKDTNAGWDQDFTMTVGPKMRTLGLIGDMSWESTALYYSGLNKGIAYQVGALLLLAKSTFGES